MSISEGDIVLKFVDGFMKKATEDASPSIHNGLLRPKDTHNCSHSSH
jgi:hypothetical protein